MEINCDIIQTIPMAIVLIKNVKFMLLLLIN